MPLFHKNKKKQNQKKTQLVYIILGSRGVKLHDFERFPEIKEIKIVHVQPLKLSFRDMVAAFSMLRVQCSLWLAKPEMGMRFPINATPKGDITVR